MTPETIQSQGLVFEGLKGKTLFCEPNQDVTLKQLNGYVIYLLLYQTVQCIVKTLHHFISKD